ncbi:MAG: S16 family serine protease [Vulcanimicrobiaceae bacterium]
MQFRLARSRAPIYVAAAVWAAALALVPTPYSLILPGRAVDLRNVVTVAGHAPPQTHFFMTDVAFAPHAVPIALLRGLAPGARIVRTADVVPKGVTAGEYDGIMHEAMDESQQIAAVVAERAARLPVPLPRTHVIVVYFSPLSRAQALLHAGDVIAAVNGVHASSTGDVARALASGPGNAAVLTVVRGTSSLQLRVPTIRFNGHAALGVYLTSIVERPRLPVPVRFNLPNVSGSSGGLMFALEIYDSLEPRHIKSERVAGTGTISYDGTIGPIEGVNQKVVAAQRAGAKLFLVPRQNYAEVDAANGIRVVPVATFAQALAALNV